MTHVAELFVGVAVILAIAFALSAPPVHAAQCFNAVASHYGTESGNRTANGERFDGSSLTAAHRSLPFGAKLRVTYRGRSVVVRINDRGPAAWTRRELDLSTAAARKIGLINAGVGRVTACRVG